MKNLDLIIGGFYLMDTTVNAGGSTALEEQQRKAQEAAAQKVNDTAQKEDAEATNDKKPAAPEGRRAPGATNEDLANSPLGNQTGTDDGVNTSDTSGTGLSSDDPIKAFTGAGAKEAAEGLSQQFQGGFTVDAGGKVLKDGKSVDNPASIPKEVREASTAAAATANSANETANQRDTGETGSTDSSVQTDQATAEAVTESNTSNDASGEEGDPSQGDNGTQDANAAKAKGAEAGSEPKLTEEQQELKAKFDNYDSEANGGLGGTKDGGDSRALHFTDESKNTLLDCSNGDCNPGSLVSEGDNKGDYKFGQGDNASYLKGADVNAAFDAHNKPEVTTETDQAIPEPKTAKSAEAAKVDDGTAIPQPKGAEVELTRALKLTSEDGKATVVRRGDGVENPNHDNAEARSHLLDGQLDSDKNTFSTFTGEDGEKYLGFYSEGYGEGDERSGIIKLSELEGKNLGADGWSAASDDQKAMLKSAHNARKEEIAKFGGVDGYNQAEKVRETVARLQAHSTEISEDGKHTLNGEGANADQIDSLNNIMERLNNNAKPLAGIQSELNELLSADKGKLAVDVAEQRLTELEGQGFSKEQIATLKENLEGAKEISKMYEGNESKAFEQFNKDLDAAIDTKRNDAHKLSGEEATKFNETIADLKTRENLSPQQQQMLSRLEAMAKDGGLDKMGKYLQTELGNLAANAPKPKPEPQPEGTRGGEAIDFKGDSFKGFQESIGDDVLKQTFGEKYAEDSDNPALKKALEDFESLKGDEKSVDAFKELLSKGEFKLDSELGKSLVEAAKKDNLEFSENEAKIKEAGLKINEAKDEASKTEAEDQKAKLEARQTELQALKDSRKGLATALSKYGSVEGKAYRELDGDKVALLKSGETGTLEGEDDAAKFKADPKEEVKQPEAQARPGEVDSDLVKAMEGNTLVKVGFKGCPGCDDYDAQMKAKLSEAGISVENVDSKDPSNSALLAKLGTTGVPDFFIKDASGNHKRVGVGFTDPVSFIQNLKSKV